MSTSRFIIVAFSTAIVIALLGYIVGYTVAEREIQLPGEGRHDTNYKVVLDTTTKPPMIADVTAKDSVPYPVPVYIHGKDSIIEKTLYVNVPMLQTHFVWPDTAEIWASGFNVTIDKAVFFTRQEIHYIEKLVQSKPKHLYCYAGAEYSYYDKVYDWKLFLEADYIIGRVSIGAKGGAIVFKDSATPFIAACLRCRLN